jgi:hypothetical protein
MLYLPGFYIEDRRTFPEKPRYVQEEDRSSFHRTWY